MTERYYCPICGDVESCPHYDQSRKPKKKKGYDGIHCPYCGSPEITALEQVQMDGASGSQLIECQECKEGWYDILRVVGWEALKD